jgi:hypothetical protein
VINFKEFEMGEIISMHNEVRSTYTSFVTHLRGDQLEDLGMDGRIILKEVLD